MFQIEVSTGEEGKVTLRGTSEGYVEFCKWVDIKDKEGKITPELKPFKFYANMSQAFNKVARMRIASSEARSIGELVECIKNIRKDIKKEMGAV